ncbi:MAG TPA: transglutaminase family protein, partial [Bryobacteraceae bacterium]
MFFTIRHITRFRYATPVSESLMEVRKHPRSEGIQRCLSFQLSVTPKARLFSYRDYLGNVIYHFDVPGYHRQLLLVSEALVDVQVGPAMPTSLGSDSWSDLDREVARGDFWEMLMPSQYVKFTPALEAFAAELGAERRSDPLSLLLELNEAVSRSFEYVPRSTMVDSPIDVALESRKGVCQDMTHVMTALVRRMRIPCRYVSGYLYHSRLNEDRSADGASHAWLECFLPELGWVGLDPTNNLVVGSRHIRTALGRDYADVPPTRGVFKGNAASELTVSVRVAPSDAPPKAELEFLEQEQNRSPYIAAE